MNDIVFHFQIKFVQMFKYMTHPLYQNHFPHAGAYPQGLGYLGGSNPKREKNDLSMCMY